MCSLLFKNVYSNGLFQPGKFGCALSSVLRGREGRSAAAQHLFRVGLQGFRRGAQKAADGPCLHGAAIPVIDVVHRLPADAQPLGGGADAVKAVRRPAYRFLRLLRRFV